MRKMQGSFVDTIARTDKISVQSMNLSSKLLSRNSKKIGAKCVLLVIFSKIDALRAVL